ncbi:MAG: ATP-binding cassette domain-containing protein [Proteobacteria bacterium]|nr:ATP-binding cassette domain-containing protein [Pseudomonadota bacterium]MBI3499458.1 ATP-binding cassette domain-containing protein [Pseudomonadota bacterium]
MVPPLLHLQDIHLTFGGPPLLDRAELQVSAGERLCLVGRNGSGKSTLLKIAAGLIEPDRGVRFLQPGTKVRYLLQEPDLSGHASAFAYVAAGLPEGEEQHRARSLLSALGLTGEEDPARLSGGEARRCALARVLAPGPDVLLLDEPTNHLDLPAIEWLEGELGGLGAALVMISHDRRFLGTLSRRTLWLDRGMTRLLDRGFEAFEAWREEVLEAEELERHKLDRKLVREDDWLRYGVTARRKRNQGRLALLQALRQRRGELRRAPETVKMALSEAEGSGTLVLEAKRIAKSFGAEPIIRDFSIRVLRGDRIGVVGPNGAGKTTLLNLLTGSLAPDSGYVRHGANLSMLTLDQRRAALDPERSVAETLTQGRGDTVVVDGQARHVIGVMRDFLFLPDQAHTPLAALSGGERGRLMLALAFLEPSNLLVLDEPTNDLDLETLDLFQDLLADYAGTVLVVSHDRDFLDRVATSVIVGEGEGLWVEYAGGYSDMLAQRGRGIGPKTLARPPSARAPSQPKAAAPSGRVRRLTFNDKHALAALPEKIEALGGEIARLKGALADPGLYARDAAEFERLVAALATGEAELQAAEDAWLLLELRREALEGC